MLFQKEKEDKNQINRLDQKRERRSRRAFFLLSPISRKTLSGKVSLCTFLKKASLTLETAMVLPLFFFGVLTLLSFMDIYKVQTEHLTGLCQKAKEAGMYAYGAGGSGTETITLPDVYSYQPIGGLIPLPKIMVSQYDKGPYMEWCGIRKWKGYSGEPAYGVCDRIRKCVSQKTGVQLSESVCSADIRLFG